MALSPANLADFQSLRVVALSPENLADFQSLRVYQSLMALSPENLTDFSKSSSLPKSGDSQPYESRRLFKVFESAKVWWLSALRISQAFQSLPKSGKIPEKSSNFAKSGVSKSAKSGL